MSRQESSILVLRRVVLRRDDQPPTLPSAPIDCLDDVDQLLSIIHGPVDLVVISRPKVHHNVLKCDNQLEDRIEPLQNY